MAIRMHYATQHRRIGSLPLCIALNSHDIGEAILEDGRHVYTTWGANLNMEQRSKVLERTGYDLVLFNHRGQAAEEVAEYLLPEGSALQDLLRIMRT